MASIALGLWFLAVKTCLTLALEAIHAILVGRSNRSEKLLSPSSYENGTHRNQSISRRRVRIREAIQCSCEIRISDTLYFRIVSGYFVKLKI